MDGLKQQLPTFSEQLTELRKPRFREGSSLSPYMRLILPIEAVLSYLLIRTGWSSRVVTLGWFLTGLVSFGAMAYGTPLSFLLGAIGVYVKIALDLTDGVIGRFQSRSQAPLDNVRTFMQGVYLDRIQHAVEATICGAAMGWGAYRLTGNQWMLASGLAIGAFRVFYRFDVIVRSHVAERFRQQAHDVAPLAVAASDSRPSGVRRIADQFLYAGIGDWFRNGKRFNLLLIGCALFDALVTPSLQPGVYALECLMWASLVLCPWLMITRVCQIQFTDLLLRETWKANGALPGPSDDSQDDRTSATSSERPE